MPKTEPDELDAGLRARLRAELDRIRPPAALPRYASSSPSVRAWRLAPVVLAVAFTGILALTAVAATGSPNPAVWTNRVETVINPPSPSPEVEASPAAPQSHTNQPAPPTTKPESPEATSKPEANETPEPSHSPEPSETPEAGDH